MRAPDLGFSLLIVIGLWSFAAAAQPPGGGPPPAPVKVEVASEQTLAPLTWVAGTAASRFDAKVAAEAEGRLVWVAEVGGRLRQGEALARLDDAVPRLRVARFEADAARERARLKFLEQEAARLERLLKDNSVARAQWDKAVADRDVTAGELAAIEAQLNEARDLLSRAVVAAPFDGVVAERLHRPGEWVNSGDEVARLVDAGRVEVAAQAPLALAPFVAEGRKVTLQEGARTLSGRIRAIVPVGDERSRLMELRIDVPPGEWTAGQTLRVGLPSAAPRKVLAVPRDALVLRRDGASVFRVNAENTAEQVPVQTGVAQGPWIEVSGALKPGDRIVTRGGERMRPGQQVRILPPDGAAP